MDKRDVELSDSRLVDGSVVLAHNERGKLMSVAVLTRAELQEFVQQAHDRYGITADPFATPGSAEPLPDALVDALNACPPDCYVSGTVHGIPVHVHPDPWPDLVGYGAGQ